MRQIPSKYHSGKTINRDSTGRVEPWSIAHVFWGMAVPFGDAKHHPFMLMFGMVYTWLYHITYENYIHIQIYTVYYIYNIIICKHKMKIRTYM